MWGDECINKSDCDNHFMSFLKTMTRCTSANRMTWANHGEEKIWRLRWLKKKVNIIFSDK